MGAGRTSATVDDVARVLAQAADGVSKREISRLVPCVGSEASVRRLLKAAEEVEADVDAQDAVDVDARPLVAV